MTTQLIPVVPAVIGSQTVQTVDGRTLHTFLEVPTQFKDWIVRRIEEYGFEADKDFSSFLSETSKGRSGGRPSKDYALTLDMAKELSMVERNAKGKQARQYFIECEKRLHAQPVEPVDPLVAQIAVAIRGKVLVDFAVLRQTLRTLYALRTIFQEVEPLALKLEQQCGQDLVGDLRRVSAPVPTLPPIRRGCPSRDPWLDRVYHYVRTRSAQGHNVMASKGDPHDTGHREIFSRPAPSIDSKGQRNTKAAKSGVLVYRVGTQRAKDLLTGRLKLTGDGPSRMHWYQTVRSDYYAQITSEVKAPSRNLRHRKSWQLKAGQRNEALDCEVGALHAARAIKLPLFKPSHWEQLERQLQQAPLFTEPPPQSNDPVVALTSTPLEGKPSPVALPSPPLPVRRQTVTRRISL